METDLLDAVVDAGLNGAFKELPPQRAQKTKTRFEEKLRGRVKRVVRDRTGKRAYRRIHAHIVKKACLNDFATRSTMSDVAVAGYRQSDRTSIGTCCGATDIVRSLKSLAPAGLSPTLC